MNIYKIADERNRWMDIKTEMVHYYYYYSEQFDWSVDFQRKIQSEDWITWVNYPPPHRPRGEMMNINL